MLKINSLTLHSDTYNCSKVNLIIGANNAGKSTLLRILHNALGGQASQEQEPRININLSMSNAKSLISSLFPDIYTASSIKDIPNLGLKTTKIQNIQNIPWDETMLTTLKADTDDERHLYINPGQPNGGNRYFQFFINMLVSFEDASSRLQGHFRTKIDNLNSIPQDIIGHLIRDRDILQLVKKNFEDTFGFSIGFDNLVQGEKTLRILPKSHTPFRPDSVEAAQWWEKNSPLVDSQGDGIRAYMKIILSLLQPYKHIVFIDEPEIFLHPPQRRALGTTIAQLSGKGDKQVFIATHDPDILRGILNSKLADVSMLHLMRENDTFSSRIIEPDKINRIIKSKTNLLAEKLLSSFFYEIVILCESENDRVFYENSSAIYYWKLFQNVNFIGFNGTTMATEIFKYLKSLNLDARLVVDIDFLIDSNIPSTVTESTLISSYQNIKSTLMTKVKNNPQFRDSLKKNGVRLFKDSDPAFYNDLTGLIESLLTKGIFIVPVGELESWTSVKKNDFTRALKIVEDKKLIKLRKFLIRLLQK
jgi:predicted ATPase